MSGGSSPKRSGCRPLSGSPWASRARSARRTNWSAPRLSEVQFAQLERELAKGPVAHGWPDRRWTLSRIRTVIGRRFHKSYALRGKRKLLIRHGFFRQVSAGRAFERDEEKVTGSVKESWPQVEGPQARSMRGSSSRTRPASRWAQSRFP
jgi:transposase